MKQSETRGLTARLPRKGNPDNFPFTSEQFDDLKALVPDWSVNLLVAKALEHYSKVLPDLLLAEKEAELADFRKKVKKVTG
ncbi:hypothetical protein BIZ83_gp039 [Erwinia phage vB_EamM_ChrisDB]|uniref:hypothetical protein n=1 Tax=Erwinia phage vB_EamM_ChrisDB TaxID=1883371 RepID=UPI00081C7A0E|nr:hypothetical protein BIZ83_gp039 [Erwinia phage vB_EamM_ChrisDB]ANZ48814.1 hypothetical protein CHRISDB_252 [Erwinia phage vB_EamM_ChrisDB]